MDVPEKPAAGPEAPDVVQVHMDDMYGVSSQPTTDVQVGDVLVVRGLEKRPDLNGCCGVVTSFRDDRAVVNLPGLDKTISVRLANLHLEEEEPEVAAKRCATCSNEPADACDLYRCSQCRSKWYCSRDCQRRDWSTHKLVCHPSGAWTRVRKQPRVAAVDDAVAMSAAAGMLVDHLQALPSIPALGDRIWKNFIESGKVAEKISDLHRIFYGPAILAIAACRQELNLKSDTEPLRIYILGARARRSPGVPLNSALDGSEGCWNFLAFGFSVQKVLAGIHCGAIEIHLIGPDMGRLSKDDFAHYQSFSDGTDGGLSVQVSDKLYHEFVDLEPPHIAICLNAGIDTLFHTWGPTLQLLLKQGVPTAITGYSNDKITTTTDRPGCERVLKLLQANVVCPFILSPYRLSNDGRENIDNGFLVAICGSDAEQNAENLPAIHLAQRLGHIDDRIAFWHENGLTGGVLFQQQKYRTIESLQNFKAAVADGTIEIPAEWCHSEMLDRWVEENGFDPKMHNPFNNTTAEETQALLTEAYS